MLLWVRELCGVGQRKSKQARQTEGPAPGLASGTEHYAPQQASERPPADAVALPHHFSSEITLHEACRGHLPLAVLIDFDG